MSDAPEMVYLCPIDDFAGAGAEPKTAEQRSTLLAECLARLGCLLASDEQHYHLRAMPAEGLTIAAPAADAPPVYLCTIDELAGASDEHTLTQMRLFGSMLVKLGWMLASRPASTSSGRCRRNPLSRASRAGHERRPAYWTFEFEGGPIRFSIQPSSAHNWLLRVEEGEAQAFTPIVATHFAMGAGVTRRMSTGTLRTQFKSSDLTIDFEDQTEQT